MHRSDSGARTDSRGTTYKAGSRPGITVRTWRDRRGKRQTRYDATYRAPDGRERSQTFLHAWEAEACLDTERADQARGRWIDPALARTPFRTWAAQWEATTQHLRPSSRLRTRGILERHLLPRFGGVPLAAIRPTEIRAFLSELTAGGLAAGSVRRIFAVLQAMMNAAEESGFIGRSPCAGVSVPAARREEPRFLDVEEIGRLVDAIPERYRALVLVAAYGGLRWAELVGLRLERIEFLRSRLTVEDAVVEVAGAFHAGPTKTGSSRLVILPRFVTEALGEHRAAFPPGAGGLVFADGRGGPLRHSNFRRRVWLPALDTAKIAPPRPRIHDLRHSAAALAIAAGAHPKAIQERLGHASITTTLNVYGHLFPALDEELGDRLDAMGRRDGAGSARDETLGAVLPIAEHRA